VPRQASQSAPQPAPRRRFRFRLRTLLVATLLAALLLTIFRELMRSGLAGGTNARFLAMLMLALAAPMILMLAAGLIRPVTSLIRRLRRRK
jgi:hypothetical protein